MTIFLHNYNIPGMSAEQQKGGSLQDIYIPEDGIIIIVGEKPKEFFFDSLSRYEKKARKAWGDVFQKAKVVYLDDLEKRGILGTHKLLSKGKIGKGMWGNIDGEWQMNQFLFFKHASGHVEGSVRTAPTLQFAWSPKENQIVITELPLDKIVFKLDENIEAPDIDFDLDHTQFVKTSTKKPYSFDIITYSNPNEYVKENRLLKAIIRVPKDEINSLKLLPVNIEE